MKKDIKLLIFGSIIIVLGSILKLLDANKFLVDIIYVIGFFLEVLGIIYLIKRLKSKF